MTRTFGIEVEGFGLSREAVAAALTTAGLQCRVEGQTHSPPRAWWKVVEDGSIRTSGRGGFGGFELVSPILSGPEGLAAVRTAMDALNAAGGKVNKSTGLHVHIGAADFTVGEFRNIAKNYVLFEDFFDAIMPPSRRGSANVFVKSNRNSMGGGYDNPAAFRAVEMLNACATIDDVIRVTNPAVQWGNDRYHKLNLAAFWVHGTIEFRQHSGTMESAKVINWIELLMQFVNRAAVTRQRIVTNPPATTPAGKLFHAFFRTFQMRPELKTYFRGRRGVLHHETGEIGVPLRRR